MNFRWIWWRHLWIKWHVIELMARSGSAFGAPVVLTNPSAINRGLPAVPCIDPAPWHLPSTEVYPAPSTFSWAWEAAQAAMYTRMCWHADSGVYCNTLKVILDKTFPANPLKIHWNSSGFVKFSLKNYWKSSEFSEISADFRWIFSGFSVIF